MKKECGFSVEQFYTSAHNGNDTDLDMFCGWLREFESIVIWGAGNLGTVIDNKLEELGIKVSAFWDAKWEKIKEKNGKPVLQTYSGDFKKESTLVIFCIANVPVSPKLYLDLVEKQWINIKGLAILEGVLCPFSKEKRLDTRICNKWDVCTVCSCERLSNIMKYQVSKKRDILEEDVLSFDRIHFIINNMCNLKCTHCFMYMNSYKPEQKRNVDINVMRRDIDMLMNAIDSLGVVNIFGGEPFLHPHLDEIVNKILEYDNFGSVIVNTNGLTNMNDKYLEPLKNQKVRLAFSNYLNQISDEQENKFKTNIHRAKEKEIVVGVQNELPTWNISSTLCKNECSIEEMREYKERCGVKFLYVHNGKIYPCAMCLSINDLGIEDYKGDYIDINECIDVDDLRKKLVELINKDYYMSCAHCDQNLGTTVCAGEQGYIDRYVVPQK